MNKRRGFTFIELLITLAIIGVLTSIVIGSVQTPHIKARDSRRVADLKEIQLALALYYDVNRMYPVNLSTLITDGYLPTLPADPTGTAYDYYYNSTTKKYCLGAVIEATIPDDDANCAILPSSSSNYQVTR